MRTIWIWYLAAIVATFIMATLGVFVRHISPGNEFTIALGRFVVGFLCLAGFAALKRDRDRDTMQPVRITWALVGSGVCLALFVVAYFKAVMSGPLANAAFLLYLGPLVASSLAAVVLGEGFNRTSGVLLGVALLGTLFITEFRIPDSTDQVNSLVFGFLSGVFYGLFLLLNNRQFQRTGSSFGRTRVQFLFASLVLIPVVVLDGVSLEWADAPWIVAIGVLHGFVALTLVVAALAYLRTIEYSTISYGEPVMAALLGVVLYDESISLLQVVGCFFVLVAGIARILIREDAGRPSMVNRSYSHDPNG